jgi:putative membrane protein
MTTTQNGTVLRRSLPVCLAPKHRGINLKNGLSLLKKEWVSILSTKVGLLSFISILFVPVIYAGITLWSFWDPYGKLDNLPVAVVNQDNLVTFNGKDLQIGDDFVSNLKNNRVFDWNFVSKEEAKKGMDDKKYYFTITIPEDFSKNAATVLDDNPEKMHLEFAANQGLNFLASQIGDSAIFKLKDVLSKTIIKSYTDKMLASIGEIGDGMQAAADGAGQLNTGVGTAFSGSTELKTNLELYASKMVEFDSGMKKATSGAGKLDAGIQQLNSNGPLLVKGANDYAIGAGDLAFGLGTLASQVGTAADGSQKITAGIQQVKASVAPSSAAPLYPLMVKLETESLTITNTLASLKTSSATLKVTDVTLTDKLTGAKAAASSLQTPASDTVTDLTTLKTNLGPAAAAGTYLGRVIDDLLDGSNQITAGLVTILGIPGTPGAADQLIAGASKFATSTQTLTAGSQAFLTGLSQAAAGAKELNSGSTQLASGSSQLRGGSSKLAEGSGKLSDGLSQINDGTGKLSGSLSDGAKQIKDGQGSSSTSDMFSSPIVLDEKEVNHVPNYGTGISADFITMGLFFGAFILSIFYALGKAVSKPESGFSWFLSKFGVIVVVSLIQSVLATLVLVGLVGLEVQSVWAFFLTAFVTSLTFIALVQMFVALFGELGRLGALFILVLSLATSGGLFPVELIQSKLQGVSSLLPMSHAVSAFKSAISIGDFSNLYFDLFQVMLFGLAFSIVTIIAFTVKVSKGYDEKNTLVLE